jgi:3-dehydroquinate synthetase
VDINRDDILSSMQLDKKAVAGKLKFILPESIGTVKIREDIDAKSLAGLLQS